MILHPIFDKLAPDEAGSTPDAIAPPAGRLGRLRILLAEDNPVNRALIIMLLEKQGHEVKTAPNGRAAVEILFPGPAPPNPGTALSFDLVLMDVEMPELDGFEATRLVRQHERHTGQHLPIIALTGQSREEDRAHCLQAGMDGYLAKPVQAGELLRAINDLVPGAPKSKASARQEPHPQDGLDRASLLSRLGGREDRLQKIVRLFLEESATLMQEMQSAIALGDGRRLRRAAHSLKGALGIFGAEAAAKAAERLESIGNEGPLAEAGPAYAALADLLAPLQQSLAAMIETTEFG